MSPSSRRAWIEIVKMDGHTAGTSVALLAEGVDRNRSIWEATDCLSTSPSSRRAWIEIGKAGRNLSRAAVALLAEGVDRNHTVCLWRCFRGVALLAEGVDRNMIFGGKKHGKMRRPPRGGRG